MAPSRTFAYLSRWTPPMHIQVRLLGQPGVISPPEADLPLGKPFALLVYLIDHGPATRDHLAEVLWSGSDRSKARASVRQAIWLLRQRLGEALFDGEDPIGLDPTVLETDLEDLIALLASGSADAARVEPLLGEPLEGLTVADAPIWRQWAEDFRSRTAHRIGSRLRHLADQSATGGDVEGACAFLHLVLRIQPERVETHLALVSHLLDLRELDAAEAQMDAVRQLGDPEAVRLLEPWEERLRALRLSQIPAGRVEIRLDFVGRSREISKLVGQLRQAARGQGQIAVVTGPAGIGKTRLVEEMAIVAQLDGVQVVQAKAHESERNIRFGAITDLVRELLSLRGSAGISAASDDALRAMVPSLSANGGAAAMDPSRPLSGSLADAFLDLVDAVSNEAPLLMVVEDLHWADDDSRALLSRTARRTGATTSLMIVTSRDAEDPGLNRALKALRAPDHATGFALGPLTRADTEELLGMLADFGSVHELRGMAERLHAVSGGHPLFLLETLRTLQERHLLATGSEGRWQFLDVDPNALQLAPTLREVLLARIDQLPDDARALAEKLARRGRPTTIRDMGLASGRDSALGPLLEAGLVTWSGDGRSLDFVHDELRDVVRLRANKGSADVRWIPWSLGGFVAAAAVLLMLTRPGAGGVEAPFGGGSILNWGEDGYVVYRARGPDQWVVTDTVSGGPYYMVPHRVAPNHLVWLGQRPSVDRAPDAVLMREGETSVVMSRESDDVAAGISPDGRTILVHSDDPDDPEYLLDTWLVSADGQEERLLRRRSRGARWSRDGLHILVLAAGPPDTVRVLRPDGSVVTERLALGLPVVDWCGTDRFVLVENGLERPVVSLVGIDGSVQPLTVPMAPGVNRAVCSPDGLALLYWTVSDGILGAAISDLTTGEEHPVDLPMAQRTLWVPDSIPPVPASVRFLTDTVTVSWGSERRMGAEVDFTDGRVRPFPLEWRSLDENVASVSADGVVAGNSVGSTRVVVSVAAWHHDTATVVVEGTDEFATVFQDSLAEVDPERWHVLGTPSPTIRADGDRSVVDLNGDGRYVDGIITRDRFSFPTGVTAEMEFRLPISRNDRQRVELCLQDTDPPGDEEQIGDWGVWIQRPSWCFRYPAAELAWFDEAVATLYARPTMQNFDVDGLLPSPDWVHVAVQVRPDGYGSVFLNRRHAFTSAVRLPDFTERRWRVHLMGAAVDTELLVRNLVVWGKARYR